MAKKIENFLLGVLWLMTVVLATTFWMNIKYGFNIFSAAHWAYLSELQAYRTDIKIDFYISLIAAIVIGLTGLYMLMRPRMNTFFIEPTQMPPAPDKTDTPTQSNIIVEPSHDEQVDTSTAKVELKRPMAPFGTRSAPITRNTPHVNIPLPNQPSVSVPQSPQHISEIKSIFEETGYIIKTCGRIEKLNNPVVALSYNQSVLIGVENVSSNDVTDAIQTLINVFTDTLGETANDMSVRGYVIGSSEPSTDLVLTFKTIDEFRKFMNEHQNNKPEDFDSELFDAVSTYISTVMNYIGKQ